MLLNFLGKTVFPDRPVWKRRQDIKHILTAILVGLILSGLIALILFLKHHRFL